MNQDIKMIVTDLDGTILNNHHQVSPTDLNTLHHLGEKRIVRVAATGRSIFSANEVLSPDFPIDYLVFSTGSGIMDWHTREMLLEHHLAAQEVEYISNKLIEMDINFSIHPPIPNTHCFIYHLTNEHGSDIEILNQKYKLHTQPLNLNQPQYERATQIRAVIPNDTAFFNKISNLFDNCMVIRATSPINKNYIWLEVFAAEVSKGKGLKYLCNKLDIESQQIVCVGNDYNDLEMLQFAHHSYWVANADANLKKMNHIHTLSATHNENGFTEAVLNHFRL